MTPEEKAHVPWFPPPVAERPNGYRCLAWHRGRWRDVMWVKHDSFEGWMTGRGSPYFRDLGRMFAPLPILPPGTTTDDFWAERS